MISRLWSDEQGAVLSAELILVMTLLFCATAVGISTLRNALVTELADVAAAIGNLNQSYTVGGITGHHSACSAQAFDDNIDSCDTAGNCAQTGSNSQCVQICTTDAHGEAGSLQGSSNAGGNSEIASSGNGFDF